MPKGAIPIPVEVSREFERARTQHRPKLSLERVAAAARVSISRVHDLETNIQHYRQPRGRDQTTALPLTVACVAIALGCDPEAILRRIGVSDAGVIETVAQTRQLGITAATARYAAPSRTGKPSIGPAARFGERLRHTPGIYMPYPYGLRAPTAVRDRINTGRHRVFRDGFSAQLINGHLHVCFNPRQDHE